MHRLLVVAHGTASAAGSATTSALVAEVALARAGVPVELCFLDVASPTLPDLLDARPTVAVPLLLSTGYHVQTDIPAAVAPYTATRVARHLGPHPLLVQALAQRLGATDHLAAIALVGAGSSRPEAGAELVRTGELLAEVSGRPVSVHSVGSTLAEELAALPQPLGVVTYLLAEGRFSAAVAAAAPAGSAVTPPIGVHPALVDLIWTRYDETLAQDR